MARILITDDDRDAGELFAELLRFAGHEIILAEDGLEAERLVREHSLDLALIDIFMPGLDGLELIRRVRAQQPSVRIIAISAGWSRASTVDAPDVLDDARELGADATLRKPINVGDLIETVRRLSGETDTAPSTQPA